VKSENHCTDPLVGRGFCTPLNAPEAPLFKVMREWGMRTRKDPVSPALGRCGTQPSHPGRTTPMASITGLSASARALRPHLVAIVSYTLIGVGAALRLTEFLANRSLSRDETLLALNITDRSWSALLRTLDFNQGAPIGFLTMQKLFATIFGPSDQSLRLFPLIASVLSVVMFFVLAREVVTPAAVPVAVGLFSVSDPLLQYSSSSKQYGIDVLVAVTAFWAWARVIDTDQPRRDFGLLAAVGAISIWLSHASAFVMAGIFIAMIGTALARRNWPRLVGAVVASFGWLTSLGIFLVTSIQNLEGVQRSLVSLPGAYSDSELASGALDTQGTLRVSLGAFRYIASVPHVLEYGTYDAGAVIALVATLVAGGGLIVVATRSPEKAVVLVAPLVLMVIAWGLHRYPLLGRTQLFLIPGYFLFLAQGITSAVTNSRRTWTRLASLTMAGMIVLTVVAPAVGMSSKFRPQENMKPVLNYLTDEQRPRDTLFVYYTAQYGFRYYLQCRCAGERVEAQRRAGLWPIRVGRGGSDQWADALLSVPPRIIVAGYRGTAPSDYRRTINALKGRRRVWVMLSGATDTTDSERRHLLAEFNRLGVQRAAFRSGEGNNSAVLYLYDFSQTRDTGVR
jgi:Dolichyl-phosphate-mannose-protein mannosyltransferase